MTKDVSPNPDVRSRWWLPSLSAMIWIAMFLGLILTDVRIKLISGDSDPAWHRILGDWMIQHRAVVREYNLLHTVHGPLVTKEWLSEVIFAAAGDLFGWNGLVLVAAAAIATCFWLLHRQLLAEGNDAVLATGLVLVAIFACSIHWIARPFLFTHLLTIAFAWQLRRFKQGRVSARRLFVLLPSLMVLWVNLHGAFLTGAILIAMYALGSTISAWRQPATSPRPWTLWALLLVCLVVSLANPNGWALPAHLLQFTSSRELATMTTENASLNFHIDGLHGFMILLLVLASVLLIVRPQMDATDLLLVGGWSYFTLLYGRNVPVFAFIVTPLLAQWLTEYVHTKHGSRWCQRYRQRATNVTAINRASGDAGIVVVVAVVLLLVAEPRISGGAPLVATDFPPTRYPVAAVDYVRSHPEVVHDEMFNALLWGGYIEFTLPGRRPFIDSRNDFYGMDLLRDFAVADNPKPGWEAIFAKYEVGWTILPVQHPLNRILELSPGWSLVFSNQQTLVFSRAS